MRVKPSFGPHKDTATVMELLDYELDTIGELMMMIILMMILMMMVMMLMVMMMIMMMMMVIVKIVMIMNKQPELLL
jgi:hypothetical protein